MRRRHDCRSARLWSWSSVVLVAMFAAFIWIEAASAAMVPLTVKQLADKSDHIVRGEVTAIHSWWDSAHDYIFTTATIRVTEAYKGTLTTQSEASIVVPGGVVGGTGFGVEHAPRFASGEEVIVFLTPIEDGQFRVTGWEQGKYSIKNGSVVERQISVDIFKAQIRAVLK